MTKRERRVEKVRMWLVRIEAELHHTPIDGARIAKMAEKIMKHGYKLRGFDRLPKASDVDMFTVVPPAE